MRKHRLLALGLPLLLVVAAAAIYFAVRPRPTQLAGTPVGPVILKSRGHLVGAPVGLANGEVFLLLSEVGGADTPPPLFAVRGAGDGLVRLTYWDWKMPCPDFYFMDGLTSRGDNDMLVFAYCHGTRRAEVDVLDPARTAVERWGEFEAVSGVAVADDGTGLILAKPLGAPCLSLLRGSVGRWEEAVSRPSAVQAQGECRFDESQPLFLGLAGAKGLYVVQGRTLWSVDRGGLVERELPFDEIRGVAAVEGQRLAVSGRVEGRDGLWLYSLDSNAANLRASGRFGELSQLDGGRSVLTGQSVDNGTQIVRITMQ